MNMFSVKVPATLLAFYELLHCWILGGNVSLIQACKLKLCQQI